MAVLSKGKATIKLAEIDANGNLGEWVSCDVPKLDSTQLNTTEGDKTEYKQEGGSLVDNDVKESTYEFTFQLYAKKGGQKPISTTNGLTTKNYAVMVIPNDPECYGFVIHKTSVSCLDSYTSADGILWEYKFTGLQTDDHDNIFDYIIYSEILQTNKNSLIFTADADSEGQTVTAEIEASETLTATVPTTDSWCTTSVSNGIVTITVSENTQTNPRSTIITLNAGNRSTTLKVYQEK